MRANAGALGHLVDLDAGADASIEGLAPQEQRRWLNLQLAQERLAFLQEPRADREALVKKEHDRGAAAAEDAKRQAAREEAEQDQKNAEAAQQSALEEAKRAKDARLRAYANERARAEGIRAKQSVLRRQLADRAADQAKALQRRDAQDYELVQSVKAKPSGADADALYDRLVKELDFDRVAFEAVLDSYTAEKAAPSFTPDPTLMSAPDESFADERAKLKGLQTTLQKDAAALDAQRKSLDADALDEAVARERDLSGARLALIDQLTPDKRDAVLGFGPEGVTAFKRELRHLQLMWRWIRVTRRPLAESLTALRDARTVATLTVRVLGLLALLIGTIFVRRRARKWLERLAALRLFRRPLWIRAYRRVLSVLASIAPETVLVVGILLAPRLLDFAADDSIAGTTYEVLLAYALYRLAIVVTHEAIDWMSTTPMGAVPETSRKVLRSLRLAGRFLLVVAIVLVLSQAALGRGNLYHVVIRLAWLVAIPIVALLVRWWRNDIAEAYLLRSPKGGLAPIVRATRGRWYGFFITVVAVVFVFAAWTVRTGRRFVLGFEHSRKALAYLFRRRLEKTAAEGGAAPDVAALPAEFRAYFEDEPTTDEPFRAERFDGPEVLSRALRIWKEGGSISSVLTVGRTGFGKTSWMNEALRRVKADVEGESLSITRIELRARMRTAEDLAARLAAAGLTKDAKASPAAIGHALRESGRRVVLIDDAQNLILRGVGTLEPWLALTELMEEAGDRVLWLGSMAHYAHEYLTWARRGVDAWRTVVDIPPWSEKEIEDLLGSRMHASGWEAVYEDLVVDRMEGVDASAQLVSTAQEYTRLIWDYAEGSPRVALHCWLRSLVPDDGKRVRVRLFHRPNFGPLDELSDERRFVLAAVAWHENLSVEEATVALRYPSQVCADALAYLREQGVLVVEQGRYRLSVGWWPGVIRYLRRKHLVET